jgi:poly(A) polymerase
VAGLGLTPVPGLVEAATSLADRMEIVSAERRCVELFRLLDLPDPGPGLALLVDAGLIGHVLPGVSDLDELALSEVLSQMAGAPGEPLMRLAVLGQVIGAAALRGMATGLRMSGRDTSDLMSMLYTIDEISNAGEPGWSDEAARRLVARAGGMLYPSLRLAAALGLDDGDLADVVSRLDSAGELNDLGPPLDGAAVMDLLGLEPGTQVGEALAWLTDLRLSEGRLDRDEAATRLSAWWADRI